MVPVGSVAPLSAMVEHEVASPDMANQSAGQREVLRCDHCKLMQFRPNNNVCRKCRKSLLPEQPKAPVALEVVPEPETHRDAGPHVASAVRDLRKVRNLSQRQLAGRMNVPRTYISKIENGKAMPTLNSLDRLARALQVDISALLRDTPTRHQDEAAVLLSDPFLAELAKYSAKLSSTQKSIFLNHVRELAQSRARKMA